MSTREQQSPRKKLKLRLDRNPDSMSVATLAINNNKNKEDKENVVPESARCYLESIEYICGHRLNLSQVTHTNCMGIPAGQRQCSNMTALPQILNSRRECRVCTTLRAGEINEANTPTPAPTSAPVTPPSNVRGSIPYRSGSSCDIVRPRPIKIRLTLDKVLRVPAAKETDEKLEAEEIEEDWETVSKKEVEGMAGKDEDWVMA